MKNVLFICKGNRFRSKIAENYLKKINKNVNVSSAGVLYTNPISKNTIGTVKKLGIDISVGTARQITENELMRADYVIVVANDVPSYLFKPFSKRVVSWRIRDCDGKNQREVELITKEIIRKVDVLNQKLGGRR